MVGIRTGAHGGGGATALRARTPHMATTWALGAGFADASLPEPIKFALQAIDFGSGSERGLSKATRERVQERNQRLKEEAEGAAEEAESK